MSLFRVNVFIILLIPLVVLAISIFLPEKYKSKWIVIGWILCGIFFVPFVLKVLKPRNISAGIFLLLVLFAAPRNKWDYDLVELSNNLEYKGTRFEYRYGSQNRTMYDPYDNFRWIYGNKPDEIYIENGTRVVVYNKKGAIIKSSNDSIEVGSDYLHHKGWMGIWSEAIEARADKDGIIHEVNDTSTVRVNISSNQ